MRRLHLVALWGGFALALLNVFALIALIGGVAQISVGIAVAGACNAEPAAVTALPRWRPL